MLPRQTPKYLSPIELTLSLVFAAGFCLLLAGCGSSQHPSVWLPTKVTHYSSYDGKLSYTTETEYDSFGNTISSNTDWADNSDIEDSFVKYDSSNYDSNGFLTSSTNADGETITYENKIEDGNLVSYTTSKGYSTSYDYYDNGVMKSSIGTTQEFTLTLTWDENGYMTSTKDAGRYSSSTDYSWEFDSSGKPISCTETRTDLTTSSYTGSNSSPSMTKYTFQCDSNGNIATIVDESGRIVVTKEYKEIKHPNTYAWVKGQQKTVY